MTTIHVQLLNEGTRVFRPTKAESVGDDLYKLLPTPNYDAEDEKWEFVPGSVVRAVNCKLSSGEVLIAVAKEIA